MANFDEILKNLHEGSVLTDTEEAITINATREFEIPVGYNTTIAHRGDVNSQIITFRLPQYHESHNLKMCQFQRLKWKNITSGHEDFSNLKPVQETASDGYYKVQWEVPPEAFTAAGSLQISISLYDLNEQGRIAFSWNTPTFGGFSVGESQLNFGEDFNGEQKVYIPAANEVLFVNEETRQIIAPSGYNNSFCNYGDAGISTIYFRIKKKFKGINLGNDTANIVINIGYDNVLKKYSTTDKNSSITKIPTFANDEGLIDFVWSVPRGVTCNKQNYRGAVKISITIIDGEKTWSSQSYNQLTINDSFVAEIPADPEEDIDEIEQAIERYLKSFNLTISPGEEY